MRKSSLVMLLIILASVLIAIYLYPNMPSTMASHWNAKGEVDGYMPRFWGLFLMPLISIAMFLLFIIIPKIDPLRKNIEEFRQHYDTFIILIMLFLLYIYLLTLMWGLGMRFNMLVFMIPALALLFFYAGVLISKAKRNWSIGIRTPWTLSSDNVWDKTHALGGKLFKLAASISLLGIVFQDYAIWFVIVPIIAVSIYAYIYSYLEYKKENSGKKSKKINNRSRKR